MSLENPEVLVTGANGFIGRAVCAGLENQIVLKLDRHGVGVNSLCVDLSRHKIDVSLPKSIKTIYHFAGQIWGDVATEKMMCDHVIEMAKTCGAEQIIFASTCAVYGQEAMDAPVSETAQNSPLSPYAEGKLAAEYLLAEAAQNYGFDVAALRYFNPFGPGQYEKMAVPAMLAKAGLGQDLEIFGDGQQVRDFIYIDDLAEATIKVADVVKGFEIYNVGSGFGVSINQLAEKIIDITHSSAKIIYNPVPDERKNLEVYYRVADISKITNACSWQPETSLSKGLSAMVEGS
ncbi:MAG: NAD-dependent epimerase/dehydratase family protein [Methylocystaceae bacterium]|nr:NAD-dependent epimerase/dehydratase family protein [Methylocystaceae bacterium]